MIQPKPPNQSTDPYGQGLPFYGSHPIRSSDGTYSLDNVPGTSGFGSRQSTLPNERPAVIRRQLIHWLIPEGPMVQMYINPQRINIIEKKIIESQRTKGGYIIQYWGEDFINLNIAGTTGTSGIEGINVLRDVYRNEQLQFDPYALFLAAKNKQDSLVGDIFGLGSSLTDINAFGSGTESLFNSGDVSSIMGLAEESTVKGSKTPPTLASLACTVEMYWSGEVYRGFFTDFTVEEDVQNLGMFNYTMAFKATQRRGFRSNFLGWHRSATSGPSNSNPVFGTPYSFSTIVKDVPSNPTRGGVRERGK